MTTLDSVASDDQARRTERKERISAVLRYVALGIIGLIMLYPMIWLVGDSFKSNAEVFPAIGF